MPQWKCDKCGAEFNLEDFPEGTHALDSLELFGKATVKVFTYLLCCLVQIACARIVAQPRPMVQYFIQGRCGKPLHSRKALHEALEVGNDGLHLCLLQHDLRDPDAIRVGLLPRQILATMMVVPVQQPIGKRAHLRDQSFSSSSSAAFNSSCDFSRNTDAFITSPSA